MARERVHIFDTTLRDGEQAPGAAMTREQKLHVARLLDRMKVDIIEAGFPVSSAGAFNAVHTIAEQMEHSTVAALSRAVREDIDASVQALKPARQARIHTFISTSPLHMHYKLQLTPEQVYERVIDSVTYARRFCDDVEWSCEDGTRSDRDFLCRCFEAAIAAGANTVNIADTVGFITPEEFFELITNLRNRVPGMEKVRFSVHCHDDLGMAVANSLSAVHAGARQIECTINGVGERAGNASLEEVVMALKVRSEAYRAHTMVDTSVLTELSKSVSEYTGFAVPPNKAVVGLNAFAHESGIHQHGVIMHRNTYEIIDPADVGGGESSLVMGRHSGRHALQLKLRQYGHDLGDNAFEDVYRRFKQIADSRKAISDEDILSLVTNRVGSN